MMCSKVEVLLNVGKSVLKMMETLWKNSLTIAKNELIIHINFIVMQLHLLRKMEELLPYCTSYVASTAINCGPIE
jgi:hypothetical protein